MAAAWNPPVVDKGTHAEKDRRAYYNRPGKTGTPRGLILCYALVRSGKAKRDKKQPVHSDKERAEKPVSLKPLKFEQAVRGLFGVVKDGSDARKSGPRGSG